MGLGTVPALTLGTDALRNIFGNAEFLTTMKDILSVTDFALDKGNSLLNPLFNGLGTSASTVASTITAPLLSNNILKKFDWMDKHQKVRWAINLALGFGAFSTASTTAPLVMTGSLAYALGKPTWKFVKGALNRTTGGAYGFVGGATKGSLKGTWNGLVKGNQWEGKTIREKLNPKIS